jgi:hypothetical protein
MATKVVCCDFSDVPMGSEFIADETQVYKRVGKTTAIRKVANRYYEGGGIIFEDTEPVELIGTAKVGDSFDVHSGQLRGTYDGYPHSAIPGRYIVIEENGSEAVLRGPGGLFRCSISGIRGIIGDWSNYESV